MNKYLWYCGTNKRVAGEGKGSQDALLRLSQQDRQAVAMSGEFCVKINDPRELNMTYWALRALPRG